MDREKLDKAAREFAAMETDDYGDIDERTTAYNNCIYGFREGAQWLLTQPLSERLTEEEKAKIIKMYKDELSDAQYHTIKMKASVDQSSTQFHAKAREPYISRLKMLEYIFGPSLFNDKSE